MGLAVVERKNMEEEEIEGSGGVLQRARKRHLVEEPQSDVSM